MFERIVLRRSVNGPAITAGELAESLFFYQNVHIVLDWSSLNGLARSVGMPTLLGVLSRPDVSATYMDDGIATNTDHGPAGDVHSLVAYRMAGDKETGTLKSKKERHEYLFRKLGYDKRQARRHFERFRRLVKFRTATDDFFVQGGLLKTANLDLLDHEYVDAAARIVTQEYLRKETLPSDFSFRVYPRDGKFTISTNIDFAEISDIQNTLDPNAGEIKPANIAQTILSASVGTIYAGFYGGDFYTSTVESRIIRIRHDYLLRRAGIDLSQIAGFKKVAIDNFPTIAEVINNGDRSFDEFLGFLKKSKKFKVWLQGRSPDENLVAAFIEDSTAKSWLDKIPAKSVRYLLGAAVSAIDEASGYAFSVSDTFFLDKILGGWKPNQFVNKQLKDFLTIDDED